ncbi:MAG: EAL domain-containing protein [Acidobacteriaceae bacterium]|nr:EAL domain-containing protein [Acidobacteriaceae bacterium]
MKTLALINRLMRAAFGSALIALLIMGAISYRGMLVSRESDQWSRHTHTVLTAIHDMRLTMELAESNTQGFALTGNELYAEAHRENVAQGQDNLEHIRSLTQDNPLQQEQIPILQALAVKKINYQDMVLNVRRTQGMEAAATLESSQHNGQDSAAIAAALSSMAAEEQRLLLLRDADTRRRLLETKVAIALATVFGLCVISVGGWNTLHDSTERGKVLELLRNSEEKYRLLLGGVQDYAIFMLDPGGKVASWNAGAERIKGYKADEILGRYFGCFFLQQDIDRGWPEHILQIAARDGRYEEEGLRVRKDGSQFMAKVVITALQDTDGTLKGFSTISHDITAEKESEDRYRGLLEAAPDAMVVLNEDGRIVLLNAQAENQFGYLRDELLNQRVTNIIPTGFAERLIADGSRTAAEALAQQIGTGIELIGRRKNGSEFPIEMMLSPLESPEGILVTAAIRDISVRRAAKEHLVQMESRYRGLLEAAPDAMVVVNQRGEIVLLNVQAEKQFGYRRDELLGQMVVNIIPEGFAERLAADALRTTEDALAQQIDTGIELCGLRKNGSGFPIEIMLSPLESVDGILVTAAIRDITLRKKSEEFLLQKVQELNRSVNSARVMTQQMAHSAEHDALTGLPNRLLLNDRVEQAIALAERHHNQVAVLFLDLDGFKHINDSLGHPIGDKLLQSVGLRLRECVRTPDTVSRQGGDEFVVLLHEVEQAEDAAISARRILQSLARAHTIDPHELHITTSIGISIYPEDGMDAEALIKNADTAMYQAKENGRQSYKFFRSAMNVRAVQRQSTEEGLRRAVERQEFALHYQPKVDLRTGEITGAEALIRWTHPTRGLISPADFIPIAEDCGLIVPIGTWVLHEACQQAQAWRAAGLPMRTIAVNVAAMQFRNERFLNTVFATLSETGLDPSALELELTESVLMKHAEFTAEILQTVRERGVQVALDDFGTGYSSLSYLRKFPLDSLKIDQSFVRQLTTTPSDTTIVSAIISMGRSLHLRIVAEGVETAEEKEFLQAQECDEAQGYYFGRPMPAEQFGALLRASLVA